MATWEVLMQAGGRHRVPSLTEREAAAPGETNALYLLYKAEEPANLTEAAKMHRRLSDYTAMTDQALATEATDLAQRVAAHRTELQKDYNWEATTITSLATDAQAFSSRPRSWPSTAKIKGATAASVLSALNTFLKDDLRAGMELLKDTHPEAYKALREAS